MQESIFKKSLSVFLSLLLLLGTLSGFCVLAQAEWEDEWEAEAEDAITRYYGDYMFTKVSNPTAGSKEPDGINTNDITGYDANRLNSYAWAVQARGDSIYVGTNRTLFGSALNAVAENLQKNNANITAEQMGNVVSLVTGGDVPVNLDEEDYIPQIIKFDVQNGTTEVIYQPSTEVGEDGRLYYTDKDGTLLPNSDVASETASFRSVIEFNGDLYFGSLGSNMLQVVRIDEDDNAKVVYQTTGQASSLRAGCVYDDGDGETLFFGGQDTTYPRWWVDRQTTPGLLPIVIRRLDPATAGSENEDWSGMVADYRDFGKYACASVYVAGGGNVWDLCSYNGKLYLILAYENGWALFRGEKGGENPNTFGWTWTEIVGDNGSYPLAMNEDVALLNQQYAEEFGCHEFMPTLTGTGLLESTATPYVFNGKMYIGSFDNATVIQSQTVLKVVAKLQAMSTAKETGEYGPSLAQIFGPIYSLLSHPQHVWVMDEDENITAVEGANALLDDTTNDYVWRFIEYNGKLYTGTFDSSTAFNYFLDFSMERVLSLLEQNGVPMPELLKNLMDGKLSDALSALLRGGFRQRVKSVVPNRILSAAVKAAASLEAFVRNETTVEDLLEDIKALETAQKALEKVQTSRRLSPALEGQDDDVVDPEAEDEATAGKLAEVLAIINQILQNVDVEGLQYWADARELAKQAESGFDIFVTEDGEDWNKITGDGLEDPYNYGARTFTICNDELYVGTANPYYGAQLWKISSQPGVELIEVPEANELTYNGQPQPLVTEGLVTGGTIKYALFNDYFANGDEAWSEEIPTATNAGTYVVMYMVESDAIQAEYYADNLLVTIDPMEITVTADDQSKFVGEDDPALTYTFDEMAPGDKLFGELSRVEGEDIGTYEIEQGTLSSSGNYAVTFIGAELTILANRTALDELIEAAENLYAELLEEYPEIAEALSDAIEAVREVDETATEEEVNDAAATLLEAIREAEAQRAAAEKAAHKTLLEKAEATVRGLFARIKAAIKKLWESIRRSAAAISLSGSFGLYP